MRYDAQVGIRTRFVDVLLHVLGLFELSVVLNYDKRGAARQKRGEMLGRPRPTDENVRRRNGSYLSLK